jgi:hypothetical protein
MVSGFQAWIILPSIIKLFTLALVTGFCICTVRMLRLARALRAYRGIPLSLAAIADGAVDPDPLARSALAGGIRYNAFVVGCGDLRSQKASAKALLALRTAEARFACLWGTHLADVRLYRRVSALMMLGSVIAVAAATRDGVISACEDRNVRFAYCLFDATCVMLTALAFELSLCGAVYAASIALERVLAKRKADWTYFCSRFNQIVLRELGSTSPTGGNDPPRREAAGGAS